MENADLWKDYQVNTKDRQRGTCSFSAKKKKNSLNRKELTKTHLEILVCIFGCLQFLINLIFFSDKPLYETFVHLCSTKFNASFY